MVSSPGVPGVLPPAYLVSSPGIELRVPNCGYRTAGTELRAAQVCQLFPSFRLPAAPVCGILGAGLLNPSRPVPLYALYGRLPAPVCELSADSHQKLSRPVPLYALYGRFPAPVCGIPGAGLRKPSRPVPLYALYGRFPAPVCELSADSHQKPSRPAPKTSQACAKNLRDWHQKLHSPESKPGSPSAVGTPAIVAATWWKSTGIIIIFCNKRLFFGPKLRLVRQTICPAAASVAILHDYPFHRRKHG